MIWFLKSNYEKILVVLAAGLLVLSLGWTWRRQVEQKALDDTIDLGAPLTGRTYAPATWRVLASDRASWPKAPEQSAGAGWLYELFTPPAIYYNAAAHAFTVTSPHNPAQQPGEGADDRPVSGAKPRLFRLQLAGYFGSPDNYLLAFVSPGSHETLLARVGRRFPELGLTLISFVVKKVPVEHDEPWPVYDIAGLATLRDERTGTEVVLDTRAQMLTEGSPVILEASTTDIGSPPVTVAVGQVAEKSARATDFSASSESERGQ